MTHLQAAFDLLGVPPGSDAVTVKKAWRALVRSYHPDMAKSDPQQANRRLAEINAAFDAVSASIKLDRNRRRAEAMARARQMAQAAERARLEALGRREAAQQAAARAALMDPALVAARTAQAGDRSAPAADAEETRALADLARKAAAAFRAVQSAWSREQAAEPRSVQF